jgi:2-polyprenyl-3-methyl-5-hydroxy-6-metoxy-1,4-benzoquinol methylase
MNRKQRRALSSGGGPPSGHATGAAPAAQIAAIFGAAVAAHRAGALAEAERQYRHILKILPSHAEAQSRMGAVLMAQGKTGEAIPHLERALALSPDLFEACGNLAQAHMAAGEVELAIRAAGRALEIRETTQGKALFALYVKTAQFTADKSGRMRGLLLRALAEGWGPPRELTGACISLIKLSRAVTDCIGRANTAWPARLAATELFGASGPAAVADDQLLCCLLECDPITDIGLERFLTNVRYAMLTIAIGGEQVLREQDLRFYGAVARQCFINEYVYALSNAEAAQALALRSALIERIKSGEPVPALWPIAVGAYFPLGDTPEVESLCGRAWPEPVKALIVQQIEEPTQERRIAATIPLLTEIAGDVSREVRQQYEENPYPRWVKMGMPERPLVPDDRPPQAILDLLIAGCGTGLSTVEMSRRNGNARILAIDLSLASLSYAKRMVQELGLADIEFAQADIMNLASIGRSFDFIDASGVLHHLADPWQGWRVLLSLLRPGGTMQIGLYSDLARQNIVAARALIAGRGYRPTPQDIRRCREDIIASNDPLLQSLVQSRDLFTTSECRDLLFHVQEHRITLPEIKTFVAANNLNFAGFMLDAATLRRFAARFPERAAFNDLDRWHVFETETPATFAAMYQFQVQKPAMRKDATSPAAR